MILSRHPTKKQYIHLPSINQKLNRPKASLSAIQLPLAHTSEHTTNLSPNEHLILFKKFQKDFNNNKLQTQFDRMLDQALNNKKYQQDNKVSQEQFVKQISKQIKNKLFQEYLAKKRQQPGRIKRFTKKRQASVCQKRSRSIFQISNLSLERLQFEHRLKKVLRNGAMQIQNAVEQMQEKCKKRVIKR